MEPPRKQKEAASIRGVSERLTKPLEKPEYPMPIKTLTGLAATALGAVFALSSASAMAFDMIGLTDKGQLALFQDSAPANVTMVDVTGTAAPLLGIDHRPANGKLYGVTADSTLYTIEPKTGIATLVKPLSVRFKTMKGAIVDFNPQADRLRLINDDGTANFRINVDTGEVIQDKPLAYAATDKASGRKSSTLAGAYINSYAGAKATQLFHIDSANGTWAIQDPPNDGVLGTIAETGLGMREIAGLDILTDAKDDYHGYAVSGATLIKVDVARGKSAEAGRIGDGSMKFIDLAFVPVR